MQITFLGTSCMKPTKDRNPSAVFLSYKSEGLLFDCGEGTQRQFVLTGLKHTKITRIFLSHWHGDHVLGLAGLIATMGASNYTGTLHIYGPRGSKDRLKTWFDAVPFDHAIEIDVHDIEEGGIFLDTKDFTVEAQPLDHRIPCLGYAFQEKDRRRIDVDKINQTGLPEGPLMGELQEGNDVEWQGKTIKAAHVTYVVPGRKVVYITDTLPTKNCNVLAKDADILICEAPHSDDLIDKATEYKHLTTKQAALIASQSNVKKLVLQHFSPRYKDTIELQAEAQEVFDNVVCAEDFMKINV